MALTERIRTKRVGMSTRRIGDELVVLDFDGSRYFTIGGSGALLFELLTEDRDRDELVDRLIEEYEVDEATARRDVDTFLQSLSRAGLLD